MAKSKPYTYRRKFLNSPYFYSMLCHLWKIKIKQSDKKKKVRNGGGVGVGGEGGWGGGGGGSNFKTLPYCENVTDVTDKSTRNLSRFLFVRLSKQSQFFITGCVIIELLKPNKKIKDSKLLSPLSLFDFFG